MNFSDGNHPCRAFCRIRMNFPGGNHPCRVIPSNQDEFPCWESSLHRNFFETGCISPVEIIPTQKFLQIRMQFSGGNHPCRAILSNQDEFLRWESSLLSNSVESGCISLAGIIPAQKFLRIRMNFSDGNRADKQSCREMLPAERCQPYQECRRLHHDFRYWLGVIPSTFLKIREK